MKKLTIIKTGILCISVCMVFLGCGTKKSPEYYSSLSESEQTSEEGGDTTESGQADGVSEAGAGQDTSADDTMASDADRSESETDTSDLCVYVCGEVINPGVYTLTKGARVCDAIELAGGFTETAAVDYLNQADYVTDSQKLYVPSQDEVNKLIEEGVGFQDGGGQSPVSDGTQTANADSAGKININTADISELTTITGIGETRAKAIVDYRTEQGGFKDTRDITNVSGIGDATYEKIKDSICVN